MAALPVLKRFQQRFFKIGLGGGLEPATGATVKFFNVGATATSATTVPPSPGQIEVPVFNVGTIAQNDEVQNGGNEAELMDVIAVDTTTLKVTVRNKTANPILIPQYGRLVRKSSPINVYRDPVGEDSLGSSLTLDAASDGWAEAYVAEYRNDVTVTGGGVTAAVYPGGEGSWVMR